MPVADRRPEDRNNRVQFRQRGMAVMRSGREDRHGAIHLSWLLLLHPPWRKPSETGLGLYNNTSQALARGNNVLDGAGALPGEQCHGLQVARGDAQRGISAVAV